MTYIAIDCSYCFLLPSDASAFSLTSFNSQARQSLLLFNQGNIYNRLRFLNKYLMFLEELNELFRENWSKFLTAGYLVFWKQFPAAGYLDTSDLAFWSFLNQENFPSWTHSAFHLSSYDKKNAKSARIDLSTGTSLI